MNIPILSYFSGGGFLDLGFEQEGFEIIWSNEISVEISKIYNSGMSSTLEKEMNISSNESIEDINISSLKKKIVKKIDTPIWGIIGGPPCPDFSIGGKNKGKNGERGKLSKTYVDHICTLKPSFFIFENVKGLIKTKKHQEFFIELIQQLQENGYAVDSKLLNALDFGIPQDRERIILLGIRKGLFRKIFRKNYSSQSDWFPWPTEKYPKAKNAFEWDKIDDFEALKKIPDELKVGSYIINQEELGKLPNSDEYFKPKSSKFSEIEEGDTSRKSFKKLHRNKFSPTAAYGNNEVHLHPEQKRRLSVREALRIQTVPDSYVISGDISLSTKFKVIGNGVPVKLSNEIAKSMKKLLDRIIE
ncbi:cytosine methyltransferase [Porphyromonas sp. COT-052 OH4946]|uniref:DNA cytosine methyltransferase n=1 Tax=Porphyromonas sp. COT-052 OH4946 TaxID=1515618 RepID=UPI00051CC9FD|nr:DNA cytosine methyltransferase [Porphyromonas sp. COT-052 OH4946]KGL56450.1 cytosine methyltransferase [Porphyromonas sp. COT-052 OH4946]